MGISRGHFSNTQNPGLFTLGNFGEILQKLRSSKNNISSQLCSADICHQHVISRDRKISPKFFCPTFFCLVLWGHRHARTQMIVFPKLRGRRACLKFLIRDVRPNDPRMSAGYPSRKLYLYVCWPGPSSEMFDTEYDRAKVPPYNGNDPTSTLEG